MLKPIPSKILRSTATVRVCVKVDAYQNPVYEQHTVASVHLQPTSEVRKSTTNTESTLRSILFADGRHSTPFDWWTAFEKAQKAGGDVKVSVRGQTYTVFSVDELRDDTDAFHHWEIGLL